jgi:hypothetical protein
VIVGAPHVKRVCAVDVDFVLEPIGSLSRRHAPRNPSRSRSQPAIWFQLVKIGLTRLSQQSCISTSSAESSDGFVTRGCAWLRVEQIHVLPRGIRQVVRIDPDLNGRVRDRAARRRR